MSNQINLNIISTPPHKCSYLPEYIATTMVVDPNRTKNAWFYDRLSQHGFRRSGDHIYRPNCPKCSACIAVRIAVQQFVPRRSQRRTWRKNQDLSVTPVAPEFKPEHYNLYRLYLKSRHEGGGMDNPTPKGYMQFLSSFWCKTVFYEYRLEKQLIAVSVVDEIENGLSAVYTFFEPTLKKRSLGVYAILWEIEEAKRLQREWLYLGYWIKNNRKMSYKTEYQPLEYYSQGTWQQFKNEHEITSSPPPLHPLSREDLPWLDSPFLLS
jgi:arginine-tRNA-protein transferase